VEDGEMFPMLRHPLIYYVPYSPMFNALINKQYTYKKESLEKSLKNKNYSSYVFIHERPYRFNAFKKIQNLLTDEEYWDLLNNIWTDSENIWQNIKEWKILLSNRPKTKHLFMSADDKKAFNKLPDTITVYRGYVPRKNKSGLSYTIDKQRAEWFAKRFHKNGKVIEKVVKKSEVFGYTNARGEQEIIIL
jgi:hypothetical protein